MTTRELDQSEWASFFDCFSRHFRGRPVMLDVRDPAAPGIQRHVARDLPLIGVTAEHFDGRITSVEILVGDSPDEHVSHVVNAPSRVSVAQISNGEDEVLVIDSETDPTVTLDFTRRDAGVPSGPFVVVGGGGVP
jgi:hypothetical protein